MSRLPQPHAVIAATPPLRPQPPAWVVGLFSDGNGLAEDVSGQGWNQLWSRRTERFTLLSASIGGSTQLSTEALSRAVGDVYRSMARELDRQGRHAVRFWNFVPDIQGHIGDGDRYMAFNVGRFSACCDWFGSVDAFGRSLATSSAVGIPGSVLWIHALAADQPGVAFDNPRQTPPYLYSRRYGPRPPCFARATRVGARLLIGGTASILGEDTRHVGDVEAQTRETFANLASLVSPACRQPIDRALAALRSLRVHVLDASDAPVVRALVGDLAPHLTEVEIVQAPLCRRELLVEIEGTAECP